mgnify:CR=1 FL=1
MVMSRYLARVRHCVTSRVSPRSSYRTGSAPPYRISHPYRTGNGMMDSERHFTAQEAATLYGIAESTVRKHIRNGRLKATKHGKAWRIAGSALETAFPNRAPIPHAKPSGPHSDPHTAPVDNASHVENGVLRGKLEASEFAHDATRRELEAMREASRREAQEVDHLRALSTGQCESIRSLTEEVKGLTAILHTRPALPRPVGWLSRLLRRSD